LKNLDHGDAVALRISLDSKKPPSRTRASASG
jgi:hypothetical protein